jgi:hypothetical protein
MQPAGPVIYFQHLNIIILGLIIALLKIFGRQIFRISVKTPLEDRHNFFSFCTAHYDTLLKKTPTSSVTVHCHVLFDSSFINVPKTWHFALPVTALCVNEYSLDGRDVRDPGFHSSYTYFEISWLCPTNVAETSWPASRMSITVADIQ